MLFLQIMKTLSKEVILFLIGGTIYYLIEFLYKTFISLSPCHWSMFILGGLCFVIIGLMNEGFNWETPLLLQGINGALVITTLELIFGYVLNIWLGLGIWDYSNVPLNFMGQICLPFSLIWIGLSIAAVILDDYLRYWLFKEEKPHYVWIKTKNRENH